MGLDGTSGSEVGKGSEKEIASTKVIYEAVVAAEEQLGGKFATRIPTNSGKDVIVLRKTFRDGVGSTRGEHLAGVHPELGAITVTNGGLVRELIDAKLSGEGEADSTWDDLVETKRPDRYWIPPEPVRNKADREGWQESFDKSVKASQNSGDSVKRPEIDIGVIEVAVKAGLTHQLKSPPHQVMTEVSSGVKKASE